MFITGNIFHLTQIEKTFCLTLSIAVPKMLQSPPPVRPKMVRYLRATLSTLHQNTTRAVTNHIRTGMSRSFYSRRVLDIVIEIFFHDADIFFAIHISVLILILN